MLGRGYLAEGDPEMIRIIERVQQILIYEDRDLSSLASQHLAGETPTEWMDVLQSREAIENGLEFFTKSLLRKFDLPGIECCVGVSAISKKFSLIH
jgi:hypothetical protein